MKKFRMGTDTHTIRRGAGCKAQGLFHLKRKQPTLGAIGDHLAGLHATVALLPVPLLSVPLLAVVTLLSVPLLAIPLLPVLLRCTPPWACTCVSHKANGLRTRSVSPQCSLPRGSLLMHERVSTMQAWPSHS